MVGGFLQRNRAAARRYLEKDKGGMKPPLSLLPMYGRATSNLLRGRVARGQRAYGLSMKIFVASV